VGGALSLILVLKLIGKPLKLVARPDAGHRSDPGSRLHDFPDLGTGRRRPRQDGGAHLHHADLDLLLAWPLLGERVRGKQWLAAASTLTGCC
jgi:hypothetical protein